MSLLLALEYVGIVEEIGMYFAEQQCGALARHVAGSHAVLDAVARVALK